MLGRQECRPYEALRRDGILAVRCSRNVLLCFLVIFLSSGFGTGSPRAIGQSTQPTDPLEQRVQELIEAMTPEQRIGQLMLVTFEGSTVEPDSEIARLIRDYHIGGVLLLPENDNIDGRGNTPVRVHTMTNSLQSMAYTASDEHDQPYLPLLIALDDQPQGISGTTPLPSLMSIGTTWTPTYARLAGAVAGQELAAMGINMLLGPSLDLVTLPQAAELLGVGSFGSNPAWVGEMAAAYISGIHSGSDSKVMVIAEAFPGIGAVDRDPALEIPVVPRTLNELRASDLVPFIRVSGGVPADSLQQVEGFQCAAVRYRDSALRTETRPGCLDETALNTLLSPVSLNQWRQGTGLMVSGALGTPAIRVWYGEEIFPHRQVARDALMAGNDLLLLADFGPEPGANSFANIADTLNFFTESYRTDPLFQERVDAALERVLWNKLALYGGDLPGFAEVLVSPGSIASVGDQGQSFYEVARQAVTLIAPSRDQLPPPPASNDSIVIFTETQTWQQCSQCDEDLLIEVDALAEAIRRLYGNTASGQIRDEAVRGYPIEDLGRLLAASDEELGQQVAEADWIVFILLDQEESAALVRKFLEQQEDFTGSQTHIVVIAMGTPYHLSSTDVSKVSAYYGLFSYSQPFIDAAARALFREVPYNGALPVSLPAINYNVDRATRPNPNQPLAVTLLRSGGGGGKVEFVEVGETIIARTEPIYDRNGHRVLDGTPVTFTLEFLTEDVKTERTALTEDGVATALITIPRAGQIAVRAQAGEASTTEPLVIFASSRRGTEAALSGTETANPRQTPFVTLTPNPTSIARATEIATNLGSPVDNASTISQPRSLVNISDFFLTLMGLVLLVIPAFSAGWATSRSLDGSLRIVLGTIVAGLTGYVYYGIGAPGSDIIQSAMGELSAMVVASVSGIAGLAFTWWTVRSLNQ